MHQKKKIFLMYVGVYFRSDHEVYVLVSDQYQQATGDVVHLEVMLS